MKLSLVTFFCLIPMIAFSSVYNCSGDGFTISVESKPSSIKIVGNGINAILSNVKINSSFDTVITGNIKTPASTIKLTIKDSNFGNPGDHFNSGLQISSASGIKDYQNIKCIRGND